MRSTASRVLRFLFYFVCLNMMFTVHASAYIDPATTSYIIQIVAGIVIAGGTAIGIFWNKMKRKFKKKDPADETPMNELKQGRGGIVTAEDLMSDDESEN